MADATPATAAATAERIQGERFLALSQRCHEQNWAQVHALAEEIMRHKRRPPPPPTREGKGAEDDDFAAEGKNGVVQKVEAEGAGEDGEARDDAAPSVGQMNSVGEAPAAQAAGSTSGAQEFAAGESTSSHVRSVVTRGEVAPPHAAPANNPAQSLKRSPIILPPPSSDPAGAAPRMLSTCLGTASPLAWTCRYSAPSATVKLVLDLDPSAVRHNVPQLGTPLHECVGRPRALWRLPLRRGRWSGVLENDDGASAGAVPATTLPPRGVGGRDGNKKKRNKKARPKGLRAPRILAGLREWRRTVRALIAADEALLREDARVAALQLRAREAAASAGGGEEGVKAGSEEWRRTVHTMIRDNVTNINRLKNPTGFVSNGSAIDSNNGNGSDDANPGDGDGDGDGDGASAVNAEPQKSNYAQQKRLNGAARGWGQPPAATTRATLAQDADGNTPVHFMVRGAASPSFGGGRFHSRHEVEEEYEDEDEEDSDDENEEENKREAMDVDSAAVEEAVGQGSAGDGSSASRAPSRDLRLQHYWGAAGASWDGVRWCMEAHLRRVERRAARRARWKDEEDVLRECRKIDRACDKTEEGDESDDAGGWVARGVAGVTIGSPPPPGLSPRASREEEGLDDTDAFGFPAKLPAKRKSLEFQEGKMKTSRRGSSSPLSRLASEQEPKSGLASVDHQKKGTSRHSKYLDDDEHQDCCYDPLLGAVRDLVHACPEALGIPDHREYEETPLIVALKSSIYVVMEPSVVDNDHFQLVGLPGGGGDGGNVGAAAAGLALLQQPLAGGGGPPQNANAPAAGGAGQDLGGGGDAAGFAVFGGAGHGVGGGPVLGGLPIGVGGGFGGGGFPFPELGALINRPFNFFPDDEAMMAVLRGHGRRVTRPRRRRGPGGAAATRHTAAVPPPSAAGAGGVAGAGGLGVDRDDDSTVSDSDYFPDDANGLDDDPRHDAFFPTANEQIFAPYGIEPPSVQLGLLPRRRPRYDYQTALEYRIFMLVRIMLDAYPRAACLMISDYTPLHSAVFHGRCPDTIRLLLDAESRFRSEDDAERRNPRSSPPPGHEPCPTLSGPAMLCTNTRGELPLHHACMRNECARSIRLLAEADPRAALVRDASGRTPLRWLWIRFVDGLLDRFGGRDTQREVDDGDDDVQDDMGNIADPFAFREQEGRRTSGNFPNPALSILGGMATRDKEWLSVNDAFSSGGRSFHRGMNGESSDEMFVFDTEYIRRTRNIDRTVDFLRMRHVPSGFEDIEYVAAEHAITVLLKLKYLQQRRNRQLEAYDAAGAVRGRTGNTCGRYPPNVPMSTKEEFILYAFEKFTALIYAVLVASDAEERNTAAILCGDQTLYDEATDSDISNPSRKKLWHSLPFHEQESEESNNKEFFLVHEACGASRASCPAAVAKIYLRLHSDELFRCDDDGRLPLHRVALRGIGWEPPGSDVDTAAQASLADETLTLLKEVLERSHENAAGTCDNHRQLPLHCAVDSLVTSLVMGKRRRASLHAEARVALQKYRHTHVKIATECLSELLQANSSALQQRDGKTGLFPFMQAATPHVKDFAVVKYTSDLSRRPGFDVGVGFSMEREIVEEDYLEAESDHVTIIYYLLREDPSVISGLC